MSEELRRSYLISPKSPERARDLTEAVNRIGRKFPDVKIVKISEKESLAVLAIPDRLLPSVKSALADEYFVEQNRPLGY
ncbi:hypothetical protein GR204_34405 [Rhizobium leguminosarum]|uniref:Uncharacterized protein n=1 Tax=Rhizobium leguminosarum TaxID=384 RepID=A0A6P0BIG7_RHILE|nr:hypothetical protein [Rhizobium leguminosarum]NEI38966.1 hypothetical protein [Rhizobium leguminosarum]NEI45696.1 hypothetical protein [Rhizobium leguminosarum]